jgi:hypothetical protein
MKSRRRAVSRLVITALAAFIAGVPVAASNIVASAATTTCANLQTALNAGGVVILSDDHLCTGSFNLPVSVTLQGADATQGFDGVNSGTRILTGAGIGAVTIQGLIFKNGSTSSDNGGAINLTGNITPRILNNTFTDNQAPQGEGGAVYVNQSSSNTASVITGNTFGTSGHGNTAFYSGGGLQASASGTQTISGNTFTDNKGTTWTFSSAGGGLSTFEFPAEDGHPFTLSNNTFTNNSNTGDGGGAAVAFLGSHTINATVSANTFKSNHLTVADITRVSHLGGGLFIESQAPGTTTQSHNLFDGNVVDAPRVANQNPAFDFGGGGEWISGGVTNSLDDTFINNAVHTVVPSNGTGVGGGLAIRGFSTTAGATVVATNLVSGGNTVGSNGEGGGIYGGGGGCTSPTCPANVTLNDSTVVDNTSQGTGPGIAGDQSDTLHLANDIVMANTGTGNSLSGFGTMTVTYTDACTAASASYTGTGNICANPNLVSVTPGSINVDETATSPTIDKGSSASVTAGTSQDYKGASRVQGAAVDMGAAEFTPVPSPPTLPAAGAGHGASLAGGEIALLALLACSVAGAALVIRREWR